MKDYYWKGIYSISIIILIKWLYSFLKMIYIENLNTINNNIEKNINFIEKKQQNYNNYFNYK